MNKQDFTASLLNIKKRTRAIMDDLNMSLFLKQNPHKLHFYGAALSFGNLTDFIRFHYIQ